MWSLTAGGAVLEDQFPSIGGFHVGGQEGNQVVVTQVGGFGGGGGEQTLHL